MANKKSKSSPIYISAGIIAASLILTYTPIPGLQQTVIIVSGTELQEPLQQLEAKFEQENPQIKLELKFQGSQDMVNKFVDHKNDFKPTILIPANGEILAELSDRLRAANNTAPFYDSPDPSPKPY